MAVAGARLDHGDLRVLDAVADEAGAAARDEHIHHAAQPHEHIRGGTIGGLHDAHAIARETAGLHSVGEHMRDCDAGVLRQRTAAQDACVARADADARGVRRHVRARLVYHRDQAQRNAHLLKLEPAVDRSALEDPTDRVGQLGERLEPLRHRLDAQGR